MNEKNAGNTCWEIELYYRGGVGSVSFAYEKLRSELQRTPRRWLITGVAGFIGSNLLETLLELRQSVVGLDNFATGHQHNLAIVRGNVGEDLWKGFKFLEGDIRDPKLCQQAAADIDCVLHQAALGSVPRSIENPSLSNAVNVDGFLNMLIAARDAKVKNFTYAASSSTYGDHDALPKTEDIIGKPLSPYAVTKYVNELYADVFARTYGINCVGLRYFNVFGKRQDPDGAYAAVIPKWVGAMLAGGEIRINGDGKTSRDFCYVENAVQANILSACADPEAINQVYNVACNAQTSLNELYAVLRSELATHGHDYALEPVHGEFRPGDVRHSRASIDKAERLLGYRPSHSFAQGITDMMPWYIGTLSKSNAQPASPV